MKRALALMLLGLAALLTLVPGAAGAAGKRVYVVHLDRMQTVDAGLALVLKQVFERAEADPQTAAVLMVIDTPGGYLDAALEMNETILGSRLKSVALVKNNAISAGALIATAAEKLYMAPGSLIGAAEPRAVGSKDVADSKTLSVVVAAYKSAAEARGRDGSIAQAFVDKNNPIPGQNTELLTLTFQDAINKRYADGQARDIAEALSAAGITEYELIDPEPTLSARLGRILTTPWVAMLLLVVGVVALGIEFMKPGVTVPGLVGIVALGLFFAGNMLVGTASWLELGLAFIGVILLVVEFFVPGFGLFGAGGVIAIAASVFMAVPDTELAMRYLAVSAVAFAVVLFFLIRTISQRGLGSLLTLKADATNWSSPRTDYSGLVGSEGKTLTVLRPAGTAQFGAQKVDVVSEGDFVGVGTPVTVIRVDGTRVVVRSMTQ